jgi:hypothetical protein
MMNFQTMLFISVLMKNNGSCREIEQYRTKDKIYDKGIMNLMQKHQFDGGGNHAQRHENK